MHATLLRYLGSSPFIRRFVHEQAFPIDARAASYVPFEVPDSGGVTWYYAWVADAWSRVGAQRGEGDYPLEIKGSALMRVEPVLSTQSTGMYFYEYPTSTASAGCSCRRASTRARGWSTGRRSRGYGHSREAGPFAAPRHTTS